MFLAQQSVFTLCTLCETNNRFMKLVSCGPTTSQGLRSLSRAHDREMTRHGTRALVVTVEAVCNYFNYKLTRSNNLFITSHLIYLHCRLDEGNAVNNSLYLQISQ